VAPAPATPPKPAPSPTDVEAAKTHYARGVQLFTEGSYEAALVELQRAYQLAPTYRLLYNTALVQMRLGDYVSALRTFRTYLEQGGAEVAAARKAEVEKLITDLSPRIASVEITTNVAGAQVSIDDQPLGTTPLAAAPLNPGRHRVVATKDGYQTTTKWIDVAGSDRVQLPLTLTETPVAVAPAPVPTPSPTTPAAPPAQEGTAAAPPPEEKGPPTWIGWTASGVLAAGAIGTGIAALSESSKLSGQINDHATDGATIHSTHSTTATLALVTDILGAAALVTAGVTLYISLSAKHHDDAPHAELRLAPGSVGLTGAF
jgi:hypothetical protein